MATSTTSYNNDRVVMGEVEYPATDPASGAFFQADYKKNVDLKMMLDGSKDSLKLEAMKRIIGMIAKGRDASDLFPAVVKNVVSKNIEIKKLVYVYLVRYAEEQQDLALLSISTFQRALKDPNQLIRASALRVLSSIRVSMLVPIVMLAIRDSASDMSPYVRKTAAHAIPKLYSLDPEQKEELVSIIDKLLSDKAPLVVGSAAMAFTEVCSERMSLLHKSYRKLCLLLADVDEWGQLALLNVLTVYAKTYFPDPNTEAVSSESETEKPFYDSDTDKPNKANSSESEDGKKRRSSPGLDPDHRLLLRAAKPLLQSRNSGVVMAVAQLFYHCGPAQELPPVAKAMIRLLGAHVEVQSVVLNAIASLTVNKRSLFEPFLKSFFVRNSDPTHIKLLKLEILTNLATEANASVVLREFQTYVTSSDKNFAAATIQAIGRLALAISSETETCLTGLLHLLSSKDERTVCEAVVVVKRVVMCGAATATPAVLRAAKLLRSDRLAGGARAAGVWLVSEHGAGLPAAPATLAHLTKNFAEQDELVKLQLLTLAIKLSITQPATLPLGQYVIQLARYDPSYDVRDRARFLSRFFSNTTKFNAAEIFQASKPAPTMDSRFKDRASFPLGSLSHYLGAAASGFVPLPAPPPAPLDQDKRGAPEQADLAALPGEKPNKTFYSEPSSGSGSSSSSSSSESESGSSEESGDDEKGSANEVKKNDKKKQNNDYRSSNSDSSNSESDSEESSSEDSGDSSESEQEEKSPAKNNDNESEEKPSKEQQSKSADKSNLELLLELDEVANTLPTMTPTCGGFLSPPTANPGDDETITPCGPSFTPAIEQDLLSRVSCSGLGAKRLWSRSPHLFSKAMLAVTVTFTNGSGEPVHNIRIGKKTLVGARSMHDFAPIPTLAPGSACTTTLGVDFADSIQPVDFTIACSLGEFPASITPPIGELMRSVTMTEKKWDVEQKKLRGMTECDKKSVKPGDEQMISQRVYETANLAAVTSTGDFLRFAGRMMSSQDLVLLSVKLEEDSTMVRANCPNMAIASLLANQVAQAFNR